MRLRVVPALAPGTLVRAFDDMEPPDGIDRVLGRRFTSQGVTYDMRYASPEDGFTWVWYRRWLAATWRVVARP